MNPINELRNLNDLNRGINKCWIWGSKENLSLSRDYLKKINYSVNDLNDELPNLSNPTMKEVIYVIVLVDWIYEAINAILKLLKKELGPCFEYKEESSVSQATEYLRAIRSFVVAHPLNTTRHEKYGLDGDFVCVDVVQETSPILKLMTTESNCYHLSLDGMQKNAINIPCDFVLRAYSEKSDGSQFSQFIRASFSDLYYVATQQIENLYRLDRYLGKLKKRKWTKK